MEDLFRFGPSAHDSICVRQGGGGILITARHLNGFLILADSFLLSPYTFIANAQKVLFQPFIRL